MSPALNNAIYTPRLATAAFTTSASLNAEPKKPQKPGMRVMNHKQKGAARTLRIKKKAFVKTGRPPAPGERKALRKRIVLSNTNALEVPGLLKMTPETVANADNVGQVAEIPGEVVDQLRAVEAFKITQAWKLFRAPSMLVREETVALVKKMEKAAAEKATDITILDGPRGTGKSMLLLQAMATAFSKGWVVISLPEGKTTHYNFSEAVGLCG